MQIYPGGLLDTKDVIGRDEEIARYWQILNRQGLVLSAERRIGKTHILFKMRDECLARIFHQFADFWLRDFAPDSCSRPKA